MLKLKSCLPDDQNAVVATYELQTAPVKGQEPNTADVKMTITQEGARVSIENMKVVEADNEDAALDALASVLESLAGALRARGEPKMGVPVYD
jgi:hypothetical protein